MENLHGKPGMKMDKRNMKVTVNIINTTNYMVNRHGKAGIKMDSSVLNHIMNMGGLLNDHITI